jgi:hypothetical protein
MHPDKSSSDTAHARFIELQMAMDAYKDKRSITEQAESELGCVLGGRGRGNDIYHQHKSTW